MLDDRLNLTAAPSAFQPCPNCHASLPVYAQYVTWCDQCGWNLEPSAQVRPRSLVERFYLMLGRHAGQHLFHQVQAMAPGTLAPAFSSSRLLTFALAVLVHMSTLALLAGGIALLVSANGQPLLIGIGILLLCMAWVLRLRVAPLPDDIVPVAQFATLHGITERIARQLELTAVPRIRLTGEFNASIQRAGLRQQPVLTLGMPLLAILSPQERVALIAHELAHIRNGDPARGLLVGSAVNTLEHWHHLLQPDALQQDGVRHQSSSFTGCITYVAQGVAHIITRVISVVPWAAAYLLTHIMWRDSQRAEYYADMLAAQVSGTSAMIETLEKLHYASVVSQSLQRQVLNPATQHLHGYAFMAALQKDLEHIPTRERDRIRRAAVHTSAQLDATHPPTAQRIALLQAHPIAWPALRITDDQHRQIEAELQTVEAQVFRAIADQYRSQLYY